MSLGVSLCLVRLSPAAVCPLYGCKIQLQPNLRCCTCSVTRKEGPCSQTSCLILSDEIQGHLSFRNSIFNLIPQFGFIFFQFKNPLILLLLASALVSVITKEYEDAASIAMVGGTSPAPQPFALNTWGAHICNISLSAGRAHRGHRGLHPGMSTRAQLPSQGCHELSCNLDFFSFLI